MGCSKTIVPEGVQEIGENAFSGCNFLSGINLPKTLKRIGKNAFYSCRKFRNITIPDGVEKIEAESFYGCGMKKVLIPNNVKKSNIRLLENAINLLK